MSKDNEKKSYQISVFPLVEITHDDLDKIMDALRDAFEGTSNTPFIITANYIEDAE